MWRRRHSEAKQAAPVSGEKRKSLHGSGSSPQAATTSGQMMPPAYPGTLRKVPAAQTGGASRA